MRTDPNLFNNVFGLQKHAALRDSFEFIAEALVASRGEFYALPGRDHELAVTVATTKVKDAYQVDAIYVDGVDVLRPEDEVWATYEGEKVYARRIATELEEQLSQELVVPTRLLKITYAPLTAADSELKVPLGYTVRKP